MQIDVNNGVFQIVMESADFDVNVGESAKIDVGQAINYVKSGEAEIQAAVQDGKAAFNLNAVAKTNEFNANASDKTGDFNTNATNKTTAFNNNASSKTTDFNDNYTSKLGDFNTNASNKTTDFNDNYVAKKALIDAEVGNAQTYAATAKQYAIGDPSEPTGNSAKYWAEQASATYSGLNTRVTTIEGKIPSDASASNQLADKGWVGSQGYITGITSGDVTTALGYTPYNSSNPNGYTSNVGTVTSVNNTSPDGNGNVTLTLPDPLPSQTGHNGEYLTTDGTDASWASISIPTVNDATLTITQDGTSIGTFTANASSDVTVAIDLSGKADVDLSNVNNSGTALSAGWAMPSTSYDVLTLGASDTSYAAPADGWFMMECRIANAGNGVNMTLNELRVRCNCSSSNQLCACYMPAKKGDEVYCQYGTLATTNPRKNLYFIYAYGSEWEKTNV